MGSIITFLIVFGLINVILSAMQNVAKNTIAPEIMTDEAIVERIKPVAQVNIGEPPVVEPVAVVATPTESDTSNDVGSKVVANTCALCHSTGMMSSPKLDNADDWAPRIEKGIDVLYDHALNGFNMMPARGGNPSHSDEEIKAAVDHMVAPFK